MAIMRLDEFRKDRQAILHNKPSKIMRLDSFQRLNVVEDIESENGGFFEGMDIGIKETLGSVKGGIGKTMLMFGNIIQQDMPNFPNSPLTLIPKRTKRTVGERLTRSGRIMLERNRIAMEGKHPEREKGITKQNIGRDIGSGLVSIAQSIGMGVTMGPGAAGVMFGVKAAGEGFVDAIAKEKDIPDALAIGGALGIAEGSLEFIGLDKFLKIEGGFIKRGIKGFLTESLQEFSQSIADGSIRTATGLKEFKGLESFIDIISGALYEGVIGGIIGGGSSVVLGSGSVSTAEKALVENGVDKQIVKEIINKVAETATNDGVSIIEKISMEGMLEFGATTFEESQKRSALIVKAMSGEKLETNERLILDTIYADFKNKGFIKEKKVSDESVEMAEQIVEAPHKMTKEELNEHLTNAQILVDKIAKAKKEVADVEAGKTISKEKEEKSIKRESQIPDFKNTEQAIKFGKQASPENIEELKKKREEALTKAQEHQGKKEYQEAMNVATEAQFYREAIEASEEKKDVVVDKVTPKITEEKKEIKTIKEFINSSKMPKFEGKAFRAERSLSQPKGTVFDIIKFESEELGNSDEYIHLPQNIIEKFKNIPAKDVVWVTKNKKDAEQYGEVEEVENLGDNPRIITEDGSGGYLVLRTKGVQKTLKEPAQTTKQKYEKITARISEIKKTKKELGEHKEQLEETLSYLKEIRQDHRRSICRYKDDYLAKEYKELPTYYKTREGGQAIDEAAQEAGFEGDTEFIQYLKNINEDVKSVSDQLESVKSQIETETRKKLIKTELEFLEKRIIDFKAGKSETIKDLEGLKSEFIKKAKEMLPVSEQGKLLVTVKNIKKKEDVLSGMQKIKNIYQKYIDKLERVKATKIILKKYKKPKNIIDVQYQKKIDEILTKLGKTKGETYKLITKMSTKELTDMATTVTLYKEKGKQLFKDKKEQRKIAGEILKSVLIKEAGGMPDGTFAKGSIEERRAKRAGMLKKADISLLSPLNVIKTMFGSLGEKVVYDSIDVATNQENAFTDYRTMKINESMKKNKVTPFNLGKVINDGNKSFQVNSILRMYLAVKDEQSTKALLAGNNLIKQEVDNFINIVKEQYPSYIKFADEVQHVVGNKYPTLAETMENIYNVTLQKVKVYFPLRRIAIDKAQEELYENIESEVIFELGIRTGKNVHYTSAEKGLSITRQNINDQFQTEISLDFIGDAFRAIKSQEHLIAFAPLQKAFNSILRDKNIQSAVKYNHSEAMWQSFNKYLDVNINPNIMYHGSSGWWNTAARHVRLGLSGAFLKLNIVTAGKQLPSLELALKYTTQQDLIRSFNKIVFSKKARETIYELDPSLRHRVITRDIAELTREIHGLPDGDLKRRIVGAMHKTDKAGFAMIMQMDKYAVLSVYDAVYRHQRKTKSEDEAKDVAHKAVIKTQPQGGMKDLPEIYRTNNELLRLGLMFTNQLNKIWNMGRFDMPVEIQAKEYKKFMVGGASIIISSIGIYIMSHGGLPDDPEEFFDAVFGSLISSVPFAGNIFMSLVRGYTPSVSPINALTQTATRVYSKLKKAEYLKAAEESLFFVAVLAKQPYSQLKRAIKGAADLISGETTDPRRLIWQEQSLK